VDGTSVHPTVWSAGQPDNATVCGGDNNRIGYWNAQQGSPRPFLEDSPDSAFIECPPSLLGRRVGAVIEWSADCNNDGIVDKGQILQGQLVDANANGVPDVCEVDPAQQAVQWRVSDGGNDHWYRLVVSGPITWPEARAASEGIGGHLATPTSAAENAFVLTISNRAANPLAWVDDFGGNSGGPWIGGYQPVNASSTQPWAWVSGEPWAWTGWAPGEPNGGFGPGLSVTGLLGYAGSSAIRGWSDAGLTDFPPYPLPPSYVVEWSADCNGDGIVDYGQILQGQLVDADANGVPDVCEVDPCPGDITNGGTVDAADLSILLAAWGTNGQAEFDTDIDGSGLVDGGDLALVLGGWGPCPQ
jgi:hypothetical protein